MLEFIGGDIIKTECDKQRLDRLYGRGLLLVTRFCLVAESNEYSVFEYLVRPLKWPGLLITRLFYVARICSLEWNTMCRINMVRIRGLLRILATRNAMVRKANQISHNATHPISLL